MPTFTDDITAMRAIKTRLATLFSTGTLATRYAGYGGVDVIIIYDESDTPEQVGRPMILLEGTGQASGISSAHDDFRSVSVTATVSATDFSGTQVGAANPTASDELLNKDLNAEFKNNYTAWRDLGLLGIDIQIGNMVASQDGDQMPVRKSAHTITFDYQRG